ncbi:MAG: M4 family metallopeptidase [Thermoflexales bacterium]|nr:M4 family metallopeptidase [Thermoflexales bacterium]
MVRFLSGTQELPLLQVEQFSNTAHAVSAAQHYLAQCGHVFGLRDPQSELVVMRQTTSSEEGKKPHTFVRFQQVYRGIPVLGGELVVTLDARSRVLAASGEVLPGLDLDITPRITPEAAKQTAIAQVAKEYGLEPQALVASEPELWIYDPRILGGPGLPSSRLVWRLEITPVEPLPIRELVLIDAQLGHVALNFNQVSTALNRWVYDNANIPSNQLQNPANLRRTEGQGPTGIAQVDRAYDYAGHTYNFYWTRHGRDSLNGAGMPLIQTVRFCPRSGSCPYQNAFWNGVQAVYGDGFVVDDVVAHEFTHGVTQFSSNLFYYYQSGAINEAFSDIWGEFVDLTNGQGNDSPSVRWLIGEELPIGAIRSMSNPPAYGHPDRMGSANYWCSPGDNGGVHSNSGVGNKAAFLMVDGGSFNGRNVTGIGIDKTAKIFYLVQAHLLTSASDYRDLYNALLTSCSLLIGTSGISSADCQQVRNALDAVEMNQQPSGCPAPRAPLCPPGQLPRYLFFDNLENPASGLWQSGAIQGVNEWYYPQPPDLTYATSGTYNFWGYDQAYVGDYYIGMRSSVNLPAGSTPYLHFSHAYDFEASSTSFFDGGVVEYSTNNGATWSDAGSLFTHNGYNGVLSTSSQNPLGGRRAFSRVSNGYISSRLNLSSLAGQSVRFRFRIGTDNSVDDLGWFIDDVRIYTCFTPTARVFVPIIRR